MSCYVSSGTLNPTHSVNQVNSWESVALQSNRSRVRGRVLRKNERGWVKDTHKIVHSEMENGEMVID